MVSDGACGIHFVDVFDDVSHDTLARFADEFFHVEGRISRGTMTEAESEGLAL